ncbi:MAG: hypothetical protein IKD78_07710 [Bacteroidales bacterium]|nr:hypothetical protein [Bacteroidales bacterium]
MENKELASKLALWIRKFSWEENREYDTAVMSFEIETDEENAYLLKDVSENVVGEIVEIKIAQFSDVWSEVELHWEIKDGILFVDSSMLLADA